MMYLVIAMKDGVRNPAYVAETLEIAWAVSDEMDRQDEQRHSQNVENWRRYRVATVGLTGIRERMRLWVECGSPAPAYADPEFDEDGEEIMYDDVPYDEMYPGRVHYSVVPVPVADATTAPALEAAFEASLEK